MKLLLLLYIFIFQITMNDFNNLFRKYHRRLLLYSLKYVESESDALDIVQNMFVAIFSENVSSIYEGIEKNIFSEIEGNIFINKLDEYKNISRTRNW